MDFTAVQRFFELLPSTTWVLIIIPMLFPIYFYQRKRDKQIVYSILIPKYSNYLASIELRMRAEKINQVKEISGENIFSHILKKYHFKKALIDSPLLYSKKLSETQKESLNKNIIYFGPQLTGGNPTHKMFLELEIDLETIAILSDKKIIENGRYRINESDIPDTIFYGYREFIDPLLEIWKDVGALHKSARNEFLNGISQNAKQIISTFEVFNSN